MKLTPAVVRAGLVVLLGVLVLSLTAWKTHPGKPKRSLLDPSKSKYMHCPECDAESAFSLDDVEKPCMQCWYDGGLVATADSLKNSKQGSRYGKMVAFLLPELVLFLAALWFVLRPRPDQGEVGYRYMRCPNCSQKLRYREAQVGGMGACSRCKRAFRFPEGSVREQELDGGEVYEEAEE
jgi:DNA-directed RNA polymerase subunit RPC12/RpoP